MIHYQLQSYAHKITPKKQLFFEKKKYLYPTNNQCRSSILSIGVL